MKIEGYLSLSVLALEEALISYAEAHGIPSTMVGTPRALVCAPALGPLALRILNQIPGLNISVVIRSDFGPTEWGLLDLADQDIFSRENLQAAGAWSAGA